MQWKTSYMNQQHLLMTCTILHHIQAAGLPQRKKGSVPLILFWICNTEIKYASKRIEMSGFPIFFSKISQREVMVLMISIVHCCVWLEHVRRVQPTCKIRAGVDLLHLLSRLRMRWNISKFVFISTFDLLQFKINKKWDLWWSCFVSFLHSILALLWFHPSNSFVTG